MKPKQSIPRDLRYTVADFNAEFANKDACLEYVKEQRWPNGVTKCEKCGVQRKHHRVTGRTAYACQVCGHHIYPLAGTVFEKSTTSLKTWFYAMYLMGSTRCGISAKQIQRETGVTYKTAWRMFRQIRSLLAEVLQLEGSTVEMDVSGDVHTNTIEGFWSTVKRGIGGVYHNVSAKYLQTYLDEYCFRYNRRDQGNLLFRRILEQVSLKAS